MSQGSQASVDDGRNLFWLVTAWLAPRVVPAGVEIGGHGRPSALYYASAIDELLGAPRAVRANLLDEFAECLHELFNKGTMSEDIDSPSSWPRARRPGH